MFLDRALYTISLTHKICITFAGGRGTSWALLINACEGICEGLKDKLVQFYVYGSDGVMRVIDVQIPL